MTHSGFASSQMYKAPKLAPPGLAHTQLEFSTLEVARSYACILSSRRRVSNYHNGELAYTAQSCGMEDGECICTMVFVKVVEGRNVVSVVVMDGPGFDWSEGGSGAE